MRRLRRSVALGAVCLSAAMAIVGCGGAAPRRLASLSPRAALQPAVPVAPSFRWTVPTSGSAPSVRAENAAPGTSSWRLPGPADLIGGVAHGEVEGYVADQVIRHGQTQTVYVNAPQASSVRIAIYRMGWYGGLGGRLVLVSGALGRVHQPPCIHSATTGLTECDWRPTLSFAIPDALASGVYVVKLTASTGAQSDCIFVLRASHAPKVLVQIPTATWEAYNAWGGDSLYPGGTRRVAITGTTRGVAVSYQRPYETETGAGQFFIREVAIVRFLERYGYPVGYTTDASIDADARQLRGVRVVIDAGHSEYWSERQQHAFARARDEGTSILFLSSDTLAWRIRYGPAGLRSSSPGAPDRTIVAYKESAVRDPDRQHPTGLFPGAGAALSGSAYGGCITPRLRRSGPPEYRYYAWRPSPALQPRWLFAHTGITARTVIAGISGYELDSVYRGSPGGTIVVGQSEGASCMGGDGPTLFHGTARQSTLYEAPSGAFVFASGTLGWLYGLYPVPEASPDVPVRPDPRVVALTRNLLARGLSR